MYRLLYPLTTIQVSCDKPPLHIADVELRLSHFSNPNITTFITNIYFT